MTFKTIPIAYTLSVLTLIAGILVLLIDARTNPHCFDSSSILCSSSSKEQCPSSCLKKCYNIASKSCSDPVYGNSNTFKTGIIIIIVGAALVVLVGILHVLKQMHSRNLETTYLLS